MDQNPYNTLSVNTYKDNEALLLLDVPGQPAKTCPLAAPKRFSPGGIAKASGFDDGPAHAKAASAKGRALDDATQISNT
jgi:hypothetical protein